MTTQESAPEVVFIQPRLGRVGGVLSQAWEKHERCRHPVKAGWGARSSTRAPLSNHGPILPVRPTTRVAIIR